MEGKLTALERRTLIGWINTGDKKFQLLYSAGVDGCNATIFHQKCDSQGPTVTVFYNTSNYVFGGYTSQHWHSNGTWINDPKAFLFRLQSQGKHSSMSFPIMDPTYAIYGHSGYGPTFGAGPDLSFTNAINKTGNYFPLNGSQGFGNSYNMQNDNANTVMGATNPLHMTEIEVYKITDGVDPVIERANKKSVSEVWRETEEWGEEYFEQLKSDVDQYCPLEKLDIPEARVLLIGPVGSGKSSFFNTVNSIFRGYVTSQACSGSADTSLTTVYRMYQVRRGHQGKPLKFRLCDTRGLEETQGIDPMDINYLLDGHIPDRYQLNPSVPISNDAHGFKRSPGIADKIHCVVFVIDGSTVEVMSDKLVSSIRSMQVKMNQKGIPQVILLTKVDKLCEFVNQDLSKVFQSGSVRDIVDKVSQSLGLPRSHVLPVKNYESEVDLKESVNILALLSLRQILRFCNDFMYNFLEENEVGRLGMKA